MGDFNQAKYIQDFQKKNYDRIPINVPKGEKEKIKAHAMKKGYESITEYVKKLIYDDMLSGGGQN